MPKVCMCSWAILALLQVQLANCGFEVYRCLLACICRYRGRSFNIVKTVIIGSRGLLDGQNADRKSKRYDGVEVQVVKGMLSTQDETGRLIVLGGKTREG